MQAYQKRAHATLEWLVKRLRETDRRITLRLVKGAYWDSEIKRAQERGLAGYPVFTRKANTDVSYLACARLLESAGERIYPQFATHNAHTIAHVAEVFGGDANRFEFQRLHGMGAELYDSVVRGPWANTPAVYMRRSAHMKTCCRISSGACSRMAPTRRSSIASSMPAFRRKRWWPIPSPKSIRSSVSPIRAFHCQ